MGFFSSLFSGSNNKQQQNTPQNNKILLADQSTVEAWEWGEDKKLDNIFKSEFNSMCTRLRQENVFNLQSLAVPTKFTFNVNRICLEDSVYVFGINKNIPYFSQLNKQVCYLVKDQHRRIVKRVGIGKDEIVYKMVKEKDKYGATVLDENGEPVMKRVAALEDVVVPRDCVAIRTYRGEPVPKSANIDDKQHFEYVDLEGVPASNGGKVKSFVYIIPRVYVYPFNRVALRLANGDSRNCSVYAEYFVTLRNGYKVRVQVVNYKKEDFKRDRYKYLALKDTTDFRDEINELLGFWVENGIIFDPDFMSLSDDTKVSNLVLENKAVSFKEYEKIGRISLADKEYGVDEEVDEPDTEEEDSENE